MKRSKNTVLGYNNNEMLFIKEKQCIEASMNSGDVLQARKRADKLCKKFKKNPEAWFILSVVCGQQSDYKQAIICCKRTIALAPNMPISYLNLGIALRMTGNLTESLKALTKSIELQPGLVNAYRELGVVSHSLGNYEDAVRYLSHAIDYAPNDPIAWISLGNVHEHNADYSEAENCYRKALEVDARSIAACGNLSNVLKKQQKIIEAENCYKDFLSRNPAAIDLIYNLAFLYQSEGRFLDAESNYRKVISLDSSHSAANNNLGLVLLFQNKFDESIDIFKSLIKLNPNNFDARRNLASVYRELNELSLAEKQLDSIIKIDQNNVAARQDRSLVLLQKGDFNVGWKEYEWRLKNCTSYSDFLPYPTWCGEGGSDKTILLYPEQGIGDEIMFSSCVMELTKEVNKVVLVCDIRMKPLFERSFPTVEVVGQSQENNISNNSSYFLERFSAVDVQLSIASLPLYFRKDIRQFEQTSAGYLMADVQAIEKWKSRFEALGDGLKIGISWRGGHVSNTKIKRSIGLDQWGEIFNQPGVTFVNLQYGECASELQKVYDLFGVAVNDWDDSDPLVNMDDFAAKIKALDLVVSIDNSTVHLAGALGVNTYLLQPYSPDWRWLLGAQNSYWYASIRQYRQSTIGQWDNVMVEVCNDLAQLVAKYKK